MKATNSLIAKLRSMLPQEAHPVLDDLDGMLGEGDQDPDQPDEKELAGYGSGTDELPSNVYASKRKVSK